MNTQGRIAFRREEAEKATSLDPPENAALLEQGPLTREELLRKGLRRFGLKTRAMDEQRKGMGQCLDERMDGHKRLLSLRREAPLEPASPVAAWWRVAGTWGTLRGSARLHFYWRYPPRGNRR